MNEKFHFQGDFFAASNWDARASPLKIKCGIYKT